MDPHLRKSETLVVRVTQAELAQIKAHADHLGCPTLADYVRTQALFPAHAEAE
jgi:hypothetical protein